MKNSNIENGLSEQQKCGFAFYASATICPFSILNFSAVRLSANELNCYIEKNNYLGYTKKSYIVKQFYDKINTVLFVYYKAKIKVQG